MQVESFPFVVHCIFFMSHCVSCPVLWLCRSHILAVNGWLVCHLLFIYTCQVLWLWFQSVLYFSAWINDSVASIGSQLSHVWFHWYINGRIIRWLMHSSNSHKLETCIPWLLNTEVVLWSLSFLTKYTITIGKSVNAHGVFYNFSGCKTFCVYIITWHSVISVWRIQNSIIISKVLGLTVLIDMSPYMFLYMDKLHRSISGGILDLRSMVWDTCSWWNRIKLLFFLYKNSHKECHRI
jgi:hypothetical protein